MFNFCASTLKRYPLGHSLSIFYCTKILFVRYCFTPCLSVCWFVCLSVCLEDFSGTAGWNGTNFGLCIHDHHPLILQRDEGQVHKVKITDFQRGGMLTLFSINQKLFDIHRPDSHTRCTYGLVMLCKNSRS